MIDSGAAESVAESSGREGVGAVGGLSELELEVIDLFVSGVRLLGIPKSIGEIYGLLYISPVPLPLDEVVMKLKISKGSASQGLKFLRKVGAVKLIYVAGERRDHFEAVTELKQLAAGFIREELTPHLESGSVRLERLDGLVGEIPDDESGDKAFYLKRLGKLGQWQRRAKRVLPFVKKVLR
ncbi:MAG: hypothetical protein P8J87_12185 [Verrucomicrobiales bacterium]|nr:hypothetical protein [Verrucomicrobiales bacterium]